VPDLVKETARSSLRLRVLQVIGVRGRESPPELARGSEPVPSHLAGLVQADGPDAAPIRETGDLSETSTPSATPEEPF